MKLRYFVILFLFSVLSAGTARAETWFAYLNGAQEVPAVATNATGYARVVLNESAGTITFTVVFSGLSSTQTASHIHAPGAIGATAAVAINFGAVGGTSGTITGTVAITPTQIAQIRAHQGYVNVHSTNFSGGEIRGQLAAKRPVDFDGDGRTDFSVLRFPNVAPPTPAPITYFNLNSTSGFQAQQWGNANTDYPTPGDYDGDGRDDPALFRSTGLAGDQAYFLILRTSDSTFQQVDWGLTGDTPVARDYDGDGKTDPATFRPGASAGAAAFFYLKNSSTGILWVSFGTTGVSGSSGDTPVPEDYDGDGKCDIAVYRYGGLSPNNTFIVRRSSDLVVQYQQWGNFNTDYVLPGDYDGDGKYDFAVARTGAVSTSPLVWYILQSSNGQLRSPQNFGLTSDVPTQGDYDGDGRTDISVYRKGATSTAQSVYYVLRSFDSGVTYAPWGVGADFSTNSFDVR